VETAPVKPSSRFALYMRNFVFGVEDSLVSTVGLLSGVAVAGAAREVILLSGIVLIFVEATSMGVGSFLSERSTGEYLHGAKKASHQSRVGALIMFVSYFVAGFIPLAPYLFTTPSQAFWISIVAGLITLFVLGVMTARALGIAIWQNGLRMLFLGGLGAIVGVVVGTFVQRLI
jgi:VIT1/CCC1 family predicted Fe2+/Mn2+ transporter